MKKLAIIGMGKMGHAIKAISEAHNFEVIAEITDYNSLVSSSMGKVDAALEFSTPDAAYSNIRWCLEKGIPVVSGTTGWTSRLPEIRAFADQSHTGFLYASNFSIGMQITFHLNRQLARIIERFPEFRARIHEVHHTQKLDQPSGTAKTLAEEMIENHAMYTDWELEPGKGKIGKNTLPVHAERTGSVNGIHEVTYRSGHEEIMLRHEAYDRSIFASGALRAAQWLIGKKGSFTFTDFLNFE